MFRQFLDNRPNFQPIYQQPIIQRPNILYKPTHLHPNQSGRNLERSKSKLTITSIEDT